MSNSQIKDALKKHRIYLWEIANRLNVSEMTICRWLRQDLPEEKAKLILNAINEIINKRTKL